MTWLKVRLRLLDLCPVLIDVWTSDKRYLGWSPRQRSPELSVQTGAPAVLFQVILAPTRIRLHLNSNEEIIKDPVLWGNGNRNFSPTERCVCRERTGHRARRPAVPAAWLCDLREQEKRKGKKKKTFSLPCLDFVTDYKSVGITPLPFARARCPQHCGQEAAWVPGLPHPSPGVELSIHLFVINWEKKNKSTWKHYFGSLPASPALCTFHTLELPAVPVLHGLGKGAALPDTWPKIPQTAGNVVPQQHLQRGLQVFTLFRFSAVQSEIGARSFHWLKVVSKQQALKCFQIFFYLTQDLCWVRWVNTGMMWHSCYLC